MKSRSIVSLSAKSKNSLYKSFTFYNTFNASWNNQVRFLSFWTFLLTQVPGIKEDINQELLTRAQVLCKNNFFLYLNVGKKFTFVTPKTKSEESSSPKEVLFFLKNSTLRNLAFNQLQTLLQKFQSKSLKLPVLTLQLGLQTDLTYKKLVYNPLVRHYNFLFFKEKLYLFSFFQKKMNFYQFNIFFRKYI
jgi:hypothetical protein